MRNLHKLPADLPIPEDDGACVYLPGQKIPRITLQSTRNRSLDLVEISKEPVVFFFYPRTGRPEAPAPAQWDQIPGARGCTPQSCGFRDLYSEFQKIRVQVFGVSSQTTEYQKEFVARNRIPYEILSDQDFALTEALKLPTFEFGSMRLIKRLALFAENVVIQKVFYPIFPPDRNAEEVLTWLRLRCPQ